MSPTVFDGTSGKMKKYMVPEGTQVKLWPNEYAYEDFVVGKTCFYTDEDVKHFAKDVQGREYYFQLPPNDWGIWQMSVHESNVQIYYV